MLKFLTKREKIFLFVLFTLTVFSFLFGEERIFKFINITIKNSFLDKLFLNIFIPLFYLLPIIPFFLLLFDKKERKNCIVAILGGIISYIFASFLKEIFLRPRPFEVLDYVKRIGEWNDTTYSFPSSTTALAFGFSLPFLFFSKRTKISYLLLFLSSSIGFFVIYTGYHWPYDVYFGIIVSYVTQKIIKNVIDSFSKKL